MKEQIDKQMSDMIKKASTAAPAGVKMMTFKEQQDFIKNECHEFPEGECYVIPFTAKFKTIVCDKFQIK